MTYLLQHLLEVSANLYPQKEAVIYKDRSISYQELHILSSKFAHCLRISGINRGDRVGIYLKKSIPAIVAIFGILKAGAIYVPLDPTAPNKRIALTIANAQIKALISTTEKWMAFDKSLLPLNLIKCLVLADENVETSTQNLNCDQKIDGLEEKVLGIEQVVTWKDILKAPSSAIQVPNLIENDIAYLLYTSGSTGIPKGVTIGHRASLTFINWSYECFQVKSTDRVSNLAPLHFDLSIFDIFTTIKAGGTIVLVPPELSVFPRNLVDFIAKYHITIWYSVPSVLIQLVTWGNLNQHQLTELRTILFAGEVFPVKYLRQLMEQIPHAEFYNLYGPTETNVCTYHQVEQLPPEQVESIPIGQACANTEVFAVNEHNELAKPGEVGELYVRSSSLMRGYWGMPDKTQEVLVPYVVNPDLGEEIVYKTGDLVKQNSDGSYLYLGRCDKLFKSRGYRIEAEEIEAVIYGHPDVVEVAVIPIPNDRIGNDIKAIVVPQSGVQISENDLKAFCTDLLPKYMIPGLIEFHRSLPKTSTGKIDRTQLYQDHLTKFSI
jgi:amino acid adenylation domain-containing protein